MKNLLEQGREPTTNSDPHKASTPRFEPGPHFWEASALTHSHHATLAPQEGGREKKKAFNRIPQCRLTNVTYY